MGCHLGVSRVCKWNPIVSKVRRGCGGLHSALYSLFLTRGRSRPGSTAKLEVAPPQMYWTHPGRPGVLGQPSRQAGSLRGAGSQQVRRPRTAEQPLWETQSERFAPYHPSVRPILFSALKTDMSNWQLVPNRVQRSLVEHFYSCLLQLDAYSCRLNEKQNVL